MKMTVRFHTTYSAGWPWSARQKTPGKNMAQLERPYIADEQYVTGTTTLENCLSTNAKDRIQKSYSRCALRRNQCVCSPKGMCKNVDSSLIHSLPKGSNSEMDIWVIVYSPSGLILTNEKELLLHTYRGVLETECVEQKKLNTKWYIVCNTIYMQFSHWHSSFLETELE